MRKNFVAHFILCCSILTACSPTNPDTDNRINIAETRKADSLRQIADSVQHLLALSDSMLQARRYDSALALCDRALSIDSGLANGHLQKGIILRTKKQYEPALNAYSAALEIDRSLGRAWYERALCHVKRKEKKKAVADLKHAMSLKYPGADSLHEKVNPLKKRVVGSHTVCCDGTTSHSTGRGTCSHHGGVCGTAYDYETYRDY